MGLLQFPISRDPPEGGTTMQLMEPVFTVIVRFPISRDPPEGGTSLGKADGLNFLMFPISRDPPEGGTFLGVVSTLKREVVMVSNF